jgi:hypothetical protein
MNKRLNQWHEAIGAAWHDQFAFSRSLETKRRTTSIDSAGFRRTNIDKLREMQAKNRAKAFANELIRLRKFIPLTKPQQQAAEQKWKLLTAQKPIVLRTDNLARALTEIGKKDAFAHHEVAFVDTLWGKDNVFTYSQNRSPEDVAEAWARGEAHGITQWGGLAKFNCVIFFEKEALNPEHLDYGHGNYLWGYIKDIGRNPILAVQVMHWAPKVLLQVTKTMLKRRPKDPIAIVDLYGNVFYP